MKIVETFKSRSASLIDPSRETPKGFLGALWSFLRLWPLCFRQLQHHNWAAMSSALSFRSIFALVPTILVAFLVLKSFGVVENSKRTLREFLVSSGLTQIARASEGDEQAAGATDQTVSVADQIEATVNRYESKMTVGTLGPIGGVLLIWTVLTFLTTMERSLNRIFEAPRSRPLLRRVLLYWSAITLGPLLLVTAAFLGEKATGALQQNPTIAWASQFIGWLAPGAIGVILLAGLYMAMPNTRIPFKLAIKGALVAVPVWLAVRWGFAIYVDKVAANSVYGKLALLPLLLLWLNLTWMILLFGAQFCYTLKNAPRLLAPSQAHKDTPNHWHLLAAALAAARLQRANEGPVTAAHVANAISVAEPAVEKLLARLTDGGLLCRVAGEGAARFVLALPAETIAVGRVLKLAAPAGLAHADRTVAAALSHVQSQSEAPIENLTLTEILAVSAPAFCATTADSKA